MLRQIRMSSFAEPAAGFQPSLVECQPQARPGNNRRGHKSVSVPLVRLVNAQTTVLKSMWLPFQISPSRKPRSENLDDRSARNFIEDLYCVYIAAGRRLQRAMPFDSNPAIRRTAKMREARPNGMILLHHCQICLPYKPIHRREKRFEEFVIRRCQVLRWLLSIRRRARLISSPLAKA